jgi:hypothetical protein
MKFSLFIIFLIVFNFIGYSQVTNEVKAKRVIATVTLRPPTDTVNGLKASDIGGINFKGGIHYYWDGSRYIPMYNPTNLIQDTFLIVNTGNSGLGLAWTSVDGEQIYLKKVNYGGNIQLIQNSDSSITITDSYSKYRTINDSSFSALPTDYSFLIINNTVSVRTATIPSASTYPGRFLTFINTGTQSITTSQLIRLTPSTTTTTVASNKTTKLFSDGTSWWLIAAESR